MAIPKTTVTKITSDLTLRRLTLEQIRRIDEMLTALPDYGEVRLIVQRGQLRYINKMESYKTGDEPCK